MRQESLRSLTLRYDEQEDRLVLRLVLGPEGATEDTCILLTRRLVQQLRQQMQVMAEQSAEVPGHLPAAAKAQVQALHHSAMATQTPTTQGEPIRRPIDKTFPLALSVQCGRQRGERKWVIRFDIRNGEPLIVTLTENTLHATIALVNRQIEQAGWNLPAMTVQHEDPSAATDPLLRGLH